MVTEYFPAALAFVLSVEGGWNDGDPVDHGGPTNLGVTQRVYDSYRATVGLPQQAVRFITRDEAEAIYRTDYWEPLGCDTMEWPMAVVTFDAAVNHGPARAQRFLTDVVWADAPAPMRAFAVMCLRRAFYRRLVEQDPSQARFLQGWLNRLERLRRAAIVGAPPAV